jgi:cell division protein FtsZ
MTLFEVDEAANRIRDEVDPEANIIFGSTFDESLDGRMRVSVVATGIDHIAAQEARPVNLSLVQARGGTALRPERPAAASQPAREQRPDVAAQARAEAPAPAEPAAETAPERSGEWPSFGAPEDEAPAEPAVAAKSTEVEQARDDGEAFVAPEPMRPAKRPVFAEQRPAAKPEPFKAAEFANAASTHGEADEKSGFRLGFGKAKRPSLFERVTGVSQSSRQPQPEPAKAAPRSEPRLDQRQDPRQEPRQEPLAEAAPRPAPAGARGQSAAAKQASLSGLEPAERPAQSREDEDLLDIPAFLRRQAN